MSVMRKLPKSPYPMVFRLRNFRWLEAVKALNELMADSSTAEINRVMGHPLFDEFQNRKEYLSYGAVECLR